MSAADTITNLINGNITAAKKGAKRHTHSALIVAGRDVLGLAPTINVATADYLKGRIDWNTYCAQTAPTWKEDGKGGSAVAGQLAAVLAKRRAQDEALGIKQRAAECDPAAVYGIAASLDKFTQAHGLTGFKANISDAYNGGDQFMREIMKLGERFETWASARVDFDQLADVWPYMLQAKFADALEAARPGAILILDTLTPEDFAAVAAELKLTLKK